ncbi:hypothetical protein CBOM_07752 [Ceraceosorus bombacis]|uniref:Uncharacterized protein n=1 Tax=Ceraceosorus bombacis TaxID=401625 RepID=A0A0N7LAU0_9BASI|nr:hypothetical protein CBOM_07752 [Ceraceosorus bombacis]
MVAPDAIRTLQVRHASGVPRTGLKQATSWVAKRIPLRSSGLYLSADVDRRREPGTCSRSESMRKDTTPTLNVYRVMIRECDCEVRAG